MILGPASRPTKRIVWNVSRQYDFHKMAPNGRTVYKDPIGHYLFFSNNGKWSVSSKNNIHILTEISYTSEFRIAAVVLLCNMYSNRSDLTTKLLVPDCVIQRAMKNVPVHVVTSGNTQKIVDGRSMFP